MTIGKKIGLCAFVISELIVLCLVFLLFVRSVDSIQKTVSEILIFQSGIMITTWGTKAVAGFRAKQEG